MVEEVYRVESDPRTWVTSDHLWQGYEKEWDYYAALKKQYDMWRGRVGVCIGKKAGMVRLRFYDTPGGKPDEAWLSAFMLKPVPATERSLADAPEERGQTDRVLDEAFGFDDD